MENINSFYINSLLADASYIDLESYQNLSASEELEDRLTPTLTAYIAENFEVLASLPSSENSGFNCVVWRGRTGTDYAGQVFVSMRGTQETEDVLDDATLATTGVAYDQIADMVNWWLRVNNPSVQKVKQIKVLTYLSNGLISRTFDEVSFRLAVTQENLRPQLVH